MLVVVDLVVVDCRGLAKRLGKLLARIGFVVGGF